MNRLCDFGCCLINPTIYPFYFRDELNSSSILSITNIAIFFINKRFCGYFFVCYLHEGRFQGLCNPDGGARNSADNGRSDAGRSMTHCAHPVIRIRIRPDIPAPERRRSERERARVRRWPGRTNGGSGGDFLLFRAVFDRKFCKQRNCLYICTPKVLISKESETGAGGAEKRPDRRNRRRGRTIGRTVFPQIPTEPKGMV